MSVNLCNQGREKEDPRTCACGCVSQHLYVPGLCLGLSNTRPRSCVHVMKKGLGRVGKGADGDRCKVLKKQDANVLDAGDFKICLYLLFAAAGSPLS